MVQITQLLIIVILQLFLINGHHISQVSFPLVGLYHSIDLRSRSDDNPILPTGSCQDFKKKDLTLFLPRVNIHTLYRGIVSSYDVSCLSFRDNHIDRIESGTFNTISNLIYLDLSKNRIPICDLLTFNSDNYKLRTLILDENQVPIDDYGRDIIHSDCFPNVDSLYLRKNWLRSLQFSLRHAFPTLRHLYLSDNYIENENFVRNVPNCLTYVYLERNRIKSFGGEIMDNVEFLFLDDNKLRSICRGHCLADRALRLNNARRLKFLSLTHNEIVRIDSDAFDDACDLMTLNLANNHIDIIKAETFLNLRNLKELDLTGNRLTKVPNLSRNTQLLTISLGYNQIEFIQTGTFRDLRLLKKIILSNNRICRIETDSFIELPRLEELDLSYNNLERLNRFWWRQQDSLKNLDVRGNHFTSFADLCLDSAYHLSVVYLQKNPMISVSCMQNLSPDIVIHVISECRAMKGRCYEQCIAGENLIW
ncbi:slit homolog 3 protein-like [Leptopilina boulardi]|uniref:slit homolog 3 protein-like n=1 Tax=Leptopilina boulardi TaxID=63433 RepID=UPI0021F50723|nr:slit homolog 3 protein-like [Leptopilina boulardi]